MQLTDVLKLLGGLAMFLFGMNVMGEALEKKAGSRLKTLLARLTSNKFKGFLLGLGITAVIQSSSATTVMVVGFVNSGVMTLGQAVGVIMGANLGTSVTSWLLSLTSLQSDNVFFELAQAGKLYTGACSYRRYPLHVLSKTVKRRISVLSYSASPCLCSVWK